MPNTAAPKPTATIETGYLQLPTSEAAEDAARALLQSIAPWLAKQLVEGGGELDLRIHLIKPATKPKRQHNVYRILAAVYEQPDQRPTLKLRKEPNAQAPT